jgi:hypothetical protein
MSRWLDSILLAAVGRMTRGCNSGSTGGSVQAGSHCAAAAPRVEHRQAAERARSRAESREGPVLRLRTSRCGVLRDGPCARKEADSCSPITEHLRDPSSISWLLLSRPSSDGPARDSRPVHGQPIVSGCRGSAQAGLSVPDKGSHDDRASSEYLGRHECRSRHRRRCPSHISPIRDKPVAAGCALSVGPEVRRQPLGRRTRLVRRGRVRREQLSDVGGVPRPATATKERTPIGARLPARWPGGSGQRRAPVQ